MLKLFLSNAVEKIKKKINIFETNYLSSNLMVLSASTIIACELLKTIN